jgi:hypothetical protein
MKPMAQVMLALSVIACACNNTVPSTNSTLFSSKSETHPVRETGIQATKEDEVKQKILNDVSIETEGGVEVNRAFLTYETDEQVPSSNLTSAGKPIYLNLVLTKGWKEEMGEVSIGASEKISTDDGTILLNEGDLFEKYNSISAEDSKFIKLKAVVNKPSASIEYYIADYKVWDKNGKGMIRGSYRFFLQ